MAVNWTVAGGRLGSATPTWAPNGSFFMSGGVRPGSVLRSLGSSSDVCFFVRTGGNATLAARSVHPHDSITAARFVGFELLLPEFELRWIRVPA
jgi:hypothetical protein